MSKTTEQEEKEINVKDPWANTEYESKENSDKFIKVFEMFHFLVVER